MYYIHLLYGKLNCILKLKNNSLCSIISALLVPSMVEETEKKCVITFIMWNAYENVQVISK
jgi:hypothetical protein